MEIKEFEWTEDVNGHIARHGVELKEIEDICFSNKPFILKSKQKRYFALGQTENGRYLTIIFSYLGKNKAKVITARAMSKSERKLYKRRK